MDHERIPRPVRNPGGIDPPVFTYLSGDEMLDQILATPVTVVCLKHRFRTPDPRDHCIACGVSLSPDVLANFPRLVEDQRVNFHSHNMGNTWHLNRTAFVSVIHDTGVNPNGARSLLPPDHPSLSYILW